MRQPLKGELWKKGSIPVPTIVKIMILDEEWVYVSFKRQLYRIDREEFMISYEFYAEKGKAVQ